MNLVPAEIRNDPMAVAIMAASNLLPRGGRTIILPVQNELWAAQMEDARWMDAYAVGNFGQRDRCFHFCAMQRQQERDGFVLVEIATNMFGFCVRDTMNDGQGVMFGGRARPGTTQVEAVEWAREWHAKRPTHREVISGYGYVE
jgi:hypothetical protein